MHPVPEPNPSSEELLPFFRLLYRFADSSDYGKRIMSEDLEEDIWMKHKYSDASLSFYHEKKAAIVELANVDVDNSLHAVNQ